MKFGLDKKTIESIKIVFSKYGNINEVLIYGSRAKGNFKNGSDIDLTLIGEKITLEVLTKIANELDDLLLPYSFDLCVFSEIKNQEFIEHIKRVGIVFYSAKSSSELSIKHASIASDGQK